MTKKDTNKDMKLASLRQQIAIEKTLVDKHLAELRKLRRKLMLEDKTVVNAIDNYVKSRADWDDWYVEEEENRMAVLRDGSGLCVSLSPAETIPAVSCLVKTVVTEMSDRPDHAMTNAAAALRRMADKLEDRQ